MCMEINRETQFHLITTKLKELKKSDAWLNREARLGSTGVADFKNGKTYVFRADKWYRIEVALGLKNNGVPIVAVSKEGGNIFPVDGGRLK